MGLGLARLCPWPVPALVAWGGAWALSLALKTANAPGWAVVGLPAAAAACVALLPFVADTPWRRVFVALGFPLSVVALGQGAGLPGWLWLLPLAVLLLAYPLHAWRDAPIYPTPRGALVHLPELAPLADPSGRVLDAGCGLGDGLLALKAAYPQARVEGVEWSWLWWAGARLRCPGLAVRRGDMWSDTWSDCELVYLFQRPETMPRAMAKAAAEMRPGSWLVSLAFEARDADDHPWPAYAHFEVPGARPVWVYRMGPARATTLKP